MIRLQLTNGDSQEWRTDAKRANGGDGKQSTEGERSDYAICFQLLESHKSGDIH